MSIQRKLSLSDVNFKYLKSAVWKTPQDCILISKYTIYFLLVGNFYDYDIFKLVSFLFFFFFFVAHSRIDFGEKIFLKQKKWP